MKLVILAVKVLFAAVAFPVARGAAAAHRAFLRVRVCHVRKHTA